MSQRGSGPARAPHIDLGRRGEEAAASMLLQKGYQILARNWRKRNLELDLICRHAGQIVFVEVKARSSSQCGGPLGAVTPAKKARLVKAAAIWLSENDCWHMPCRFDVVGLVCGDSPQWKHIVNAFETSEIMDCGHASWQF